MPFSPAPCCALRQPGRHPVSGTLSPATPELTYTYGPNAVSNPSGTAELTCQNPVLACDAYALTVDSRRLAGDDHDHLHRLDYGRRRL